MAETIRIGGACGFWGESSMATPQLLAEGGIDYLVYDYLAEITMSIMARARIRDPAAGYATDFVTETLAPNLDAIADQGVKILSNAGGVNPAACAGAIRRLLDERGLDLTVAVVTGDDLMEKLGSLEQRGLRALDTGAAWPAAKRVASVNAYLGAGPILEALSRGADIVVTGRCADSALALAACRHAFGWAADDWDRLAAGSLAGHLLECGPQATGGNFTDWHKVADTLDRIGYPIAEVRSDGQFTVTKPTCSGGQVTPATVAEQLVYEIDDPQAYLLPDVVCDFSRVELRQDGPDRVTVGGARGRPAPDRLKVSTTWLDGYRGGMLLSFTGTEAAARARCYAGAALRRAEVLLEQAGAEGLTETSVEVIGAEDAFGDFRQPVAGREAVLKIAARHPAAAGISAFIKAVTGLALATPPGLSIFHAGRPRPSPVVRLHSSAIPREEVQAQVTIAGEEFPVATTPGTPFDPACLERPAAPATPPADGALVEVPLVRLAVARSGDKGNRANIGVIARRPEYLPWLWRALTAEAVAARFRHFLEGPVDRFLLPGIDAINFVLHDVLGGGGVASLRNDPQGKSYAQILLAARIPVPSDLESDGS
jgi:hypothetical protein